MVDEVLGLWERECVRLLALERGGGVDEARVAPARDEDLSRQLCLSLARAAGVCAVRVCTVDQLRAQERGMCAHNHHEQQEQFLYAVRTTLGARHAHNSPWCRTGARRAHTLGLARDTYI